AIRHLHKREDVLVWFVAADADLASRDRERFRAFDTAFDFDEPERAALVLGLDVVALVVGRHLACIAVDCVLDSKHCVDSRSLDDRSLKRVVGNFIGRGSAKLGEKTGGDDECSARYDWRQRRELTFSVQLLNATLESIL